MARHAPGTWFLMDKEAVERIARHSRTRILLPVYVALCYHADKIGRCFPSYPRLLGLTGMVSRANLAEALHSLEALGIIRRERRQGKVTTYLVLDRTGSVQEPVAGASSPEEPHRFSPKTTPVPSQNHTSSPGEPEEEVFKRNHEEDCLKRKERTWQEKKDNCQFIQDMKGLVAPIDKRVKSGWWRSSLRGKPSNWWKSVTFPIRKASASGGSCE